MTSHVLPSRVLHFITDQDYRHVGIGEPAQTGENTCLTHSVLRPWKVTGQLKVAGEHEHASGPMDKSVTTHKWRWKSLCVHEPSRNGRFIVGDTDKHSRYQSNA